MRRRPKPKRSNEGFAWQRPPRTVAMPEDAPNPMVPQRSPYDRGGRRPATYKPEFVEVARKLVDLLGATEQNLADYFGVTFVSLWRWKLRYPEFAKALELTPERRIKIIEHSLYLRGTGYSHPAVKIFAPMGEGKEAVVVPYTEYYPPDVSAINLYLSNRDPRRWKKRLAPPEDPPQPGAAQDAERKRREGFALMMQIIEDRARRGEPPIFAKPPVLIEQHNKKPEGALATAAAKGNGSTDGKGKQ
jgi:hypothetical protein